MTMVRWLAVAGASLLALASTAFAQESTPIPEGALSAFESQAAVPAEPSFSDPQRAEIDGIIQDYIRNNPQVILQALQAFQQQQQRSAQQQQTRAQTTASVGGDIVDVDRDQLT